MKMATGVHWCRSCYGRNLKTSFSPAQHFSPNLSHDEVEQGKWRNEDTTNPRIGSGEKFVEKHEEKSDESQVTSLQPSETQPSTSRRHRATYKRWQLDILEDAFEANCYPSTMFKRFLAARLDLENVQVQVWFQNRRARMKKDGSERRSPYVRNYPPCTRHYFETQRNLVVRASPYTYFPRSPVVNPMFSGCTADRVLRHDHPAYNLCAPWGGHEADDVMVRQLLSTEK